MLQDLHRRAYALVRLALFNEQRRMPLRRDDISKKVLGSKSRRFADILMLAQATLRKTFGMELVELHRSQVVEEKTEKDPKKKQKQNTDAVGMKKKAAPTGTKTWILRTVLDPQLISLAVLPDDDIKAVEQAPLVGGPDNGADNDNDDAGVQSTNTGAILAWQDSDQLSAIGILYVVLALVLVHGRALGDGDLRRILKRLRIPLSADVPLNSRSTAQSTIDAYLAQCARQGYLERHRVGQAKVGADKKRGRAPAGTQRGAGGEDEGDTWEWKWGPRAMAEIGEADMARFVAEFMVDSSMMGEEDDDGEARAVNEARRKKKLETMMKGVERASGGDLVDVAVVHT
ncbi:MAGE family-domain-containing protein [Cytidiella melzeri]|nr:MAGE family-domain-containing protein [Cytidiella melzeri]